MTDPDTSPEAVERAIGMCRAHGLHGTAATLSALSAALLDVSKREAAMMARYDAKLEAAEAQRDALKAELADIAAMFEAGQGDDDGAQILPDFDGCDSIIAKVEACLHLLEKRRDTIAGYEATDEESYQIGVRADLCDPTQDERVRALVGLLREAREDLEDYIENDWPPRTRAKYPSVAKKWQRDMELCRRIDAALRTLEGGE